MLGVLVVSHSEDAARGIAQIAAGMSENKVVVDGVGGNDEGGLGVSVIKVLEALLRMAPKVEGILIVPDLGSSVLSSRGAIGMLSAEVAAKVKIADAPALEGAMIAAVEAGCGASLEKVAEAAQETWSMRKLNENR
jgi:dihydroxyacetone kinase phosphotransfer subunit